MINNNSFNYIPSEKHDECYKSLLTDVYYLYYNIKPNENEMIITIDGNKWNMDKDNLKLNLISNNDRCFKHE